MKHGHEAKPGRGKKILVILLATASVAMLLDTFLDEHGWTRRRQLQQHVARLRAENTEQQRETERLTAEIEGLKMRRDVQEKAIRDELGYVKPGEIILKLPEPNVAGGAPPRRR